MRVRILKTAKGYRKGDTAEVSRNVAFGLIDSGIAQLTKDIAPDDYKQAGELNGSTSIIRSDNKSRR